MIGLLQSGTGSGSNRPIAGRAFPADLGCVATGELEALDPAGVAGRRALDAGRRALDAGRRALVAAPLAGGEPARSVDRLVTGVDRGRLGATRRVTWRLVVATRGVRAGLEMSLDALGGGFEEEEEGVSLRSGRGSGGSWGTWGSCGSSGSLGRLGRSTASAPAGRHAHTTRSAVPSRAIR